MAETEVPERFDQPRPIPRRTVKVSDDVFEHVNSRMGRNEDFSNALRRVLFGGEPPDELNEEYSYNEYWQRRRVRHRQRLPSNLGQKASELEVPLLQALQELGVASSREKVEEQIESSGVLTLEDRLVNGNRPIWKNRLSYASRNLIKEGCMSSVEGAWDITAKGRARLEMELKYSTGLSKPSSS